MAGISIKDLLQRLGHVPPDEVMQHVEASPVKIPTPGGLPVAGGRGGGITGATGVMGPPGVTGTPMGATGPIGSIGRPGVVGHTGPVSLFNGDVVISVTRTGGGDFMIRYSIDGAQSGVDTAETQFDALTRVQSLLEERYGEEKR